LFIDLTSICFIKKLNIIWECVWNYRLSSPMAGLDPTHQFLRAFRMLGQADQQNLAGRSVGLMWRNKKLLTSGRKVGFRLD
jgi:hypothetical protein